MKNQFNYGIETEYILVSLEQKKFLWGEEINFTELYNILEEINTDDLGTTTGLDAEDAHKKNMFYVVEGYHLKDNNNISYSMIPKGVEIRTPVTKSIDECLKIHFELKKRLIEKLNYYNFDIYSLSHHPNSTRFEGPRCNRKYEFWLWAKEVMTTYGPDINISYPLKIEKKIFSNLEDFEAKVNYYAPALTALTLNSPIFDGKVKKELEPILSHRTKRRSKFAPMIEPHLNENGRMEFKFFEMPTNEKDLEGYILFCLGLSLCDELTGRQTYVECQEEMQRVAKFGLNLDFVQTKLHEIFQFIPNTLKDFGFNPAALEPFLDRFNRLETPADELIKKIGNSKINYDLLMSYN